MAGAGRQQGHIARGDRNLVATGPSQHEPRAPGGEAQHLVRIAMVVVKAIDAVAPLRRPAVAPKQLLKRGRGIATPDGHYLSVEQHWQARIVGHTVVGAKLQDCWHRTLSPADRTLDMLRREGAREGAGLKIA